MWNFALAKRWSTGLGAGICWSLLWMVDPASAWLQPLPAAEPAATKNPGATKNPAATNNPAKPTTPANPAAAAGPVHPLLDLPGSGQDETQIDYAQLPLVPGRHVVISATDPVRKFQLHSYLAHYQGQFFCCWSQGPPVEDEPSQEVRFATSADGLNWSASQTLTGLPQDGYAYIARGLWLRDGQLLALAAHFKGKGAFGVNKELELLAWSWDATTSRWQPRGRLFENAINNFPPQRLSSGPWMMTRRDARFNVYLLQGGVEAIDRWESIPVIQRLSVPGFSPDEPIWWEESPQRLVALFRDNAGSSRVYHATSADQGRTWTLPVKTNLPNSSSKLFSLATSTGQRCLISNANPQLGRRELHLSLYDGSRGLFTRMARLDVPSPRPGTLQYPHALEHDGRLLVVFSRLKNQIELLDVPLAELEKLAR